MMEENPPFCYAGQTIIHTRAFTLKDVEYIQEVLNKNFELRTRLEEKKQDQ
jgi:hypothetical protein